LKLNVRNLDYMLFDYPNAKLYVCFGMITYLAPLSCLTWSWFILPAFCNN